MLTTCRTTDFKTRFKVLLRRIIDRRLAFPDGTPIIDPIWMVSHPACIRVTAEETAAIRSLPSVRRPLKMILSVIVQPFTITSKIRRTGGMLLPVQDEAFCRELQSSVQCTTCLIEFSGFPESQDRIDLHECYQKLGFRMVSEERKNLPGWRLYELPEGWSAEIFRPFFNADESVIYHDENGASRMYIINSRLALKRCDNVWFEK